ncbi:unnamed protein product [Candidula unifasciata]|uniref:Solute carrier organic anion transporter family member n=1 Tax=Candidula unifasciata TaxID=100452 RepID=A0A8S3Z8E9_9EUPU|nr:unnamed protein product [Candidula unifasciata]
MALQGFGKAPRFSFSVVYVDDNTAKVNTGFYAGTILSSSVLGPAVAFLLGGVFSRMYVTLEATQLTPRHPNWIGAWWLGYIVFGVASLVVAVPLFCFPRKLPRKNVKDTHNLQIPAPLLHLLQVMVPVFLEFLASLYRLLVNPLYVFLLISAVSIIFTAAGNMSFFSKYLERMFHLPVHVANYTTSGVVLCTSCFGTFIGGFLSSRMKMTAKTCLKFLLVMTALCFAFQIMVFIFHCEQPTVHNRPGEENVCNRGCNCRDNSYFPICGDDGRTYYSPCHAGCLQAEHGIYQNCSCVAGGRASGGTCYYSCSHLYGYVVAAGMRNLFMFLGVMPKFVVFIRCVPERDRSMALAVLPLIAAIFGWMLAPIVFGNAIDQACLIWDINCLTRGRCLLYDNNQFRVTFNGYGALGAAGSLVFVVIAYLYARWSRCLEEGVQTVIAHEVEEIKFVVKDSTVNI